MREGVGVEEVAVSLTRLAGFRTQGGHFGVGVLTTAGDLQENLHAGAAARDAELVAGDLLGDEELRKTANRSQLVAEIVIERREPIRERDGSGAVSADPGVPAIHVHHLARLSADVVAVFPRSVDVVFNA